MQRNSLENKILEKENILVVLPENPKLELLSAVLGFALALERLNKNVRIISDDSYRKYGFLRPPKHISSDIDDYGEIFISIDTKNNIVSELRYEKLDDEIRIYLGSEGAGLKKNSVSAKFLNTPYDLILVFGVDSAGELENFYKKNTDIFEGADV
ncbi:hypothetical protein HY249_03425, partial [Candidatus Azambacteria bacterium]|nr:hypothetical protein [Candidatus Azambacteria bacterium]